MSAFDFIARAVAMRAAAQIPAAIAEDEMVGPGDAGDVAPSLAHDSGILRLEEPPALGRVGRADCPEVTRW